MVWIFFLCIIFMTADERLAILIQDIEGFVKEAETIDYVYEHEKLVAFMKKFWEYILSFNDEEVFDHFLHTKIFEKTRSLLSLFENFYERSLETKESMIILSGVLKSDNKHLLAFAEDLFVVENYKIVQQELNLFEQKNIKKLAMVGCGPLPETIIFLAENTEIETIIGIDNNQEAIFLAGEVLRALGLERRVKLLCSSGETVDYSDFDAIHIANSVWRKNAILERIEKTGKDGVEVLIRIPFNLSHLIRENVSKIPYRFIKKYEGGQSLYQLNSYLLLEKSKI